jgi:hypothetical protein
MPQGPQPSVGQIHPPLIIYRFKITVKIKKGQCLNIFICIFTSIHFMTSLSRKLNFYFLKQSEF